VPRRFDPPPDRRAADPEQRAKEVRDMFPTGLQPSAGPVGRGAADPVGSNETEAGRRQNRRVLIKVRQPKP
jgi:outer membrane protein OmpA-like peptidoglycan-associated protein